MPEASKAADKRAQPAKTSTNKPEEAGVDASGATLGRLADAEGWDLVHKPLKSTPGVGILNPKWERAEEWAASRQSEPRAQKATRTVRSPSHGMVQCRCSRALKSTTPEETSSTCPRRVWPEKTWATVPLGDSHQMPPFWKQLKGNTAFTDAARLFLSK